MSAVSWDEKATVPELPLAHCISQSLIIDLGRTTLHGLHPSNESLVGCMLPCRLAAMRPCHPSAATRRDGLAHGQIFGRRQDRG